MKRFIYKTSFFLIPFALLYFITLFFYSDTESPDLIRIGYIPNIYKNYRAKFSLNKKEKFEKLSSHKKKSYKVMTIGDSFSEQKGFGYKNMLADHFSVLHLDRIFSENPIQTLIYFANGDFFDNYNVEYVILQNVERHIVERVEKIQLKDKLMLSQIDSIILNHKIKNEDFSYKFFSTNTVEFPLYYLPKFFLKKNYLSNKITYNVELNTASLFSNKSSKLLFFSQDRRKTEKNNTKEKVDSLNLVFNILAQKLRQKNIKLIVLPSPDKYDFYYDYITEKKEFKKPLFFDLMKAEKKDYIYIDSKEILTANINKEQDIYFYDDTHWSPVASKIIVDKLKSEIEKSDNSTNPILSAH
jgi:hypothetical protein